MSALKQAISAFFEFKWRITSSLLFAALTILAGTGLIAASGYLITWAALKPPILDMILVLVAVRFFGISRAAFRYVERLISHDLTFRILKKLRVEFYKAVEPVLPEKAIRFRSGDLLSRFSDDVDRLQELYLKVLSPIITAALFILMTVAVTAYFSITLATAVFVLMMLNAAIMPFLVRMKAGKTADTLSSGYSDLSHFMKDHVQGASDLLLSGSREEWIKKGEEQINRISAVQNKRSGAFSMESGLFTLVSHASIPVSFLILLPMVLEGELSGLMMAAIVLGLFTVFEALEPVGNAVQHAKESAEAAERLYEFSIEKPERKPNKISALFTPEDSSILMLNVSFGYNIVSVLKNVDLEIRPGEHVILKGASGSGKSTIAHLLVKWFEPWEGQIFIGNRPVSFVDGDEVRKYISVVGQHTRLFNTTLRNNLRIAKPDANDRELMELLEKVQFGPAFEKLPRGLDTQVGELGLRLSGGERQRVAIARALLKNTPIWILDEPLSSLGRTMADEILQSIKELTADKTVLHITHQTGSLKLADRVYEMVDGELFDKKSTRNQNGRKISG